MSKKQSTKRKRQQPDRDAELASNVSNPASVASKEGYSSSDMESCHGTSGRPRSERSREPCVYRDCPACEHMIQQEVENHPFMRELQEKFERYHYKLLETKNDNLLLKRELAMAKKVICSELGIDNVEFRKLLAKASEEGWKGRNEKVLVLQTKNRQLEDKLRAAEGKEPLNRPSTTPSEEQARKNIPEDRKAFWRMELEKRKGYEMGDKQRSDLLEENADLRKKLENSRTEVKDLKSEIKLMKGEMYAYEEKSRDENELEESLLNLEQQLKTAMEERSEYRRELVGEKHRYQILEEQFNFLKEQVEKFKNRSKNDKVLIEGLSDQNKRLQILLDEEHSLSQQRTDHYESSLRKLQGNNSANLVMLQSVQAALQDKDTLVLKLQEQLEFIDNFLRTKETEQREKAEREEEEKREKARREKEEAGEEEEEEEVEDEEKEELSPEEEKEKMETELQDMRMELAKFRGLYESARDEADHMADMISLLNQKVDEINIQLVQSQQMYLRNEMDRKELQEKIEKLEQDMKGKKKKKKLKKFQKAKGSKVSMVSVSPGSKVDLLALKLDVISEENDFLRSFLSTTIGTKAQDYRLFRNISENAEKRFAADIESIKEELARKKEEEKTAEEDEEGGDEEDDEEED